MITIQQMIREIRKLREEVNELLADKKARESAPVEIPQEMEPVVRRGRPRKTEG